jgi:hypothetical protein
MKVLLYAVFKDLVVFNIVASELVNGIGSLRPLGSSLNAPLNDDLFENICR